MYTVDFVGDLIDIAAVVLAQAERRLEVASQNIANMSTPGYKRRIAFSSIATAKNGPEDAPPAVDFSPGKAINTQNPYDLAILGKGFFEVQSDEGVFYTRQGQFQLDNQGRLVTPQGYVLQSQDGGDLVLQGGTLQVQSDGTVLENGDTVGTVGVVDLDTKAATPAQDGMFSAPASAVKSASAPVVQQGMLESSNVSTADEMLVIMAALRRAEAAQKLGGVYDDLLGQALTTFGQS